MIFRQSHHMSMHVYNVIAGRLSVTVTNRPQLFEERKLPKVRGWWVRFSWRAKA